MTKGQRIKQLREGMNMTQEELASRLNTTKQTISKYEKDIVTNIPSDRIEAMATVLNTTPEDILGWKNEKITISEDVKKKTELANDIVIRMGSNAEFCELVKILYKLDTKKLSSIKNLLANFIEQWVHKHYFITVD